MTWPEAVLFANLASVQHSLQPCYYVDMAHTVPLTSNNIRLNQFYCDFSANGYRLLTEGEWEYTCRAGTTGAFYLDEPNYSPATCTIEYPTIDMFPALDTIAWFRPDSITRMTSSPVATKLPNAFGLYDMHGNLWEWCWDYFDYDNYPSGSVVDYRGPSGGAGGRTLRGGCWYNQPQWLRAAYRDYCGPTTRIYGVGFRLARYQ